MKEFKIVNGPSEKKVLFVSNVLATSEWHQSFQMREEPEDPSSEPIDIQLYLQFLGRPRVFSDPKDEEKNSEYCFIGKGMTAHPEYNKRGFFIGQYNARTRSGACYEIPQGEFFNSPLACMLYGEPLPIVAFA